MSSRGLKWSTRRCSRREKRATKSLEEHTALDTLRDEITFGLAEGCRFEMNETEVHRMPYLGGIDTGIRKTIGEPREALQSAELYMKQALSQGRPSSRCGSDSPAFLNLRRPNTTVGRSTRGQRDVYFHGRPLSRSSFAETQRCLRPLTSCRHGMHDSSIFGVPATSKSPQILVTSLLPALNPIHSTPKRN